ncbi:MAG: KxYKxGKxW signal peptide domain-containing protein, partial [Apilactobacillus sp.]|nr:KxYKxGKxW signal peptide domain-containing protein [Apilactobacillus sp.]
MQYNKNEIQKTNDKKILRKVKKQWVVVSLSSFALLGATSLALMSHDVKASAQDNPDTHVSSVNQNTSDGQSANGNQNTSDGQNADDNQNS